MYYNYFKGIRECLNEYETIMNGENVAQGELNEYECDFVKFIDFYIAKALIKETCINAEKIAKFILVAKGLSGDIKVK